MKQYGEMGKLDINESQELTTQIVAATGWNAVFVDENENGDMVMVTEPVACWALISHFDNHYSMTPLGTKVVGLIASQGLGPADDLDSFVDYLPAGGDLVMLDHYAHHVFDRLKKEEAEEDNEDYPESKI